MKNLTNSIRYSSNPIRREETRRNSYSAAGLWLAVLCATAGCNGLPSASEMASETPKDVPQTYMAPAVGDTTNVTSVLETYTFDNKADTFQQATNQLRNGSQLQINNAGNIKPLLRGLLELETTYSYPFGTTDNGTTYNPPETGSWAVQLPDYSGGLVQLLNQPFAPLVAAVCPSSTTAQTYQFITLPNALLIPSADSTQNAVPQQWNPAFETAYGSVAISGGGSNVTFADTQQLTLSGAAPGTAYAASATGVCSSTLYGNTISVPGQLAIANPGNGETVSASATIGISASGLLVEDNGSNLSNGQAYANGLGYQNALGAGTGAIGLLKPSTAVDTGALTAAQYNGFIYGGGNASSPRNFSSTVASFGYSSLPASCAAVAPATGTLIYGGDFTNNDPSAAAVQSAGGFGNCDYAIDLGQQSGSSNGYYPAATVYVGANFPGNTTGVPYSFPAIAIAGQAAGKYAIFLLGVDTTGSPKQAQGIYLLQSN